MGVDLRKLAADLREARRYVRSNPDEAKRQAAYVGAALLDVQIMAGERESQIARRLTENLAIGGWFGLVAPDVFAGYLEGAAFELEILAGPIEVPEVGDAA